MSIEQEIRVEDSRGFQWLTRFVHQPGIGLSSAYYKSTIICACEIQKVVAPWSDNDSDWEAYDERVEDFKSEALSNLIPECKIFYDNQTPQL